MIRSFWKRLGTAPGIPRFLIAGSYGHGNTGDEAILRAIVEGLRQRWPGASIRAVAGDEASVRDRLAIDTVSWVDWPGIFRSVRDADLVIVGGGGIFFDTAGFAHEKLLTPDARDLVHYLGVPLLASVLRRRWMVFGCGAGPLRSREGRSAVQAVLGGADAITVRDEGSAAELFGAGVPRGRIRVTADPAFLLRSDRNTGDRVRERLRELGLASGARWFAVAPRDLKDTKVDHRWEVSLIQAIRAQASRTGASVLLLPFHRGWDEPVLERVAAGLDGIPHAILAGSDDRDTAWAVSHSQLAVAMRFHSLVFALAGGVPAVSLAYEPKVEYLATRAGFGRYCFSMDDAGQLDRALRDVEGSRSTLERDARTAGEHLRRSAAESFEVARELVSRRDSPVSEPPAELADLTGALLERIRLLEAAAGGRP